MDSKIIIILIVVAAYVAFAGLLISIPFRIKKLKKECGELKMKLRSEFPLRSILAFVICALLIGVIPLRSFELYVSAIFAATSVLATYIASCQVVNSGMNGVFENMIISDTTAVKYDEIMSLPTLAYENDEDTVNVDFRLIEVLKKNGAKVTFAFPDEAKRNQALQIILEQAPQLKV